MFLVDTHAHLYLDAFSGEREEIMRRMAEAGVKHVLLPNIDRESVSALHALEAAFPGKCHAMMGLHPTSVGPDFRDELSVVRSWIDKRDYIGVGEIGIDLYWDKTYLEEQKEAFGIQLDWAYEKGLPVAIHMRDSYPQVMEVLKERPRPGLRGVFHCFSGDSLQAAEIVEAGFLLGIGGVLTFRNSRLAEAISDIAPRHIILETDAPYLAPVPHRGKRNESSYLVLVAERLAEAWGISTGEVASITTGNACRLFRLPNPYDHA